MILQKSVKENNMEILITVIIPVYNVEKYLNRCLESVIKQTYKNLEIICVNDGSTDKSSDILKEYAKKDKRIKIVEKENGGLSSARNAGLEIAKGEFIGFIDSDDWINPTTYEKAISKMAEDIDIVCWGANIVNEMGDNTNKAILEAAFQYHKIKLNGKIKLDANALEKLPVTSWNKLFKKSIIDKHKIRFPYGFIHEDIEFLYKYLLYGNIAFVINEGLYYYVQRTNSIMSNIKNTSCNTVYLKIFKRVFNYYEEQNKTIEYENELLKLFEGCLYCDCRDNKNKEFEIFEYAKEITNNFHIIYKSDVLNQLKNNNFEIILKWWGMQ